MTNTPINQFSEDGMRRIAAAVRRVEQTPTMRQSLDANTPTPQARVLRWARTTTNYDCPTYPSSGPAYVVEFGDYGISPDPVYPGATVSKSFTAYSPQVTVVAVDPDGGTHAEGSVVRIERHGSQWWIRPAAGAATHPCLFQDFYSEPYDSLGIDENDSPDFYTIAYLETLGSRTDNFCSRLDLSASGDPFTAISQTGAYRISMTASVSMASSGATDSTLTTSNASAGTAHTHTVDAYNGNERVCDWSMLLEYRVGGSGSWTVIPGSTCFQTVVQSMDGDPPFSTMTWDFYANLTSGWQIRQKVGPHDPTCTPYQKIYMQNARLLLHYIGSSLTADTT